MQIFLINNSWIHPSLHMNLSTVHGRGLIATAMIHRGDIVLKKNIVIGDANAAGRAYREGKFVLQIDDSNSRIDVRDDEELYYINHSCLPNTWLVDDVTLAARCTILSGQEITADYATWKINDAFVSAWICHCGERSCRGRISGKDWMFSKFQRRYQDHVASVIQKKIFSQQAS